MSTPIETYICIAPTHTDICTDTSIGTPDHNTRTCHHIASTDLGHLVADSTEAVLAQYHAAIAQ
eukprot:2000073-Rhodomonas_salina.1